MDIQAFVNANRKELAALVKELCAIPAPSGNEGARARFCRDWFERAGCPDAYIDEALNAVCPYNVEPGGAVVIFMAHTDTVFPDLEPMPMREEGGRLYCPGAGDDTANLAIMMLCARHVMQNAIPADTGVLFVANAGEEGLGNLKGCRQLMRDFEGRIARVISFDGSRGNLVDGAVGSARYRVSVATEGGHSYGSFGNRNAIHALARVITELYEIAVPVKEGAKTTYNVGLIEGGTSVNSIAQDAAMLYEYRSNSRECLEHMERELNAVIARNSAAGPQIGIELLGLRPCAGEVDPVLHNGLLHRCERVIESNTGKKPKRNAGSTDCNMPLSLGIPAACMGLIRSGGAHTRGEWLDMGSLPLGLQLGMELVIELMRA